MKRNQWMTLGVGIGLLIVVATLAIHRSLDAQDKKPRADGGNPFAGKIVMIYEQDDPSKAGVGFVLAYYLVFFAWGTVVRARRLLVVALRADAERERAEHGRRLADTRRLERQAIAREMHDVLAHRISLVSVHAGALA